MTNYIKDLKSNTFLIDKKDDSDFEYHVKLNPGYYDFNVQDSMFGKKHILKAIETKKLISFETGSIKTIIDSSKSFFDSDIKQKYKDLNNVHNLGIILHGKAGVGKTGTAQLLIEHYIKTYNAIALNCTSRSMNQIMLMAGKLREIQNNPIIFFVDEVDSFIYDYEDELLTFLDGHYSVDNSIFLACTNFLDKIPDRIKNRKSRIKFIYEIKAFPIETYREIILNKLPKINNEELHKFAFLAEQNALTMDEIKHSIIDYYVNGFPIEDAIINSKQIN